MHSSEVLFHGGSESVMVPPKILCIRNKMTVVFRSSRIGILVFSKHLLVGHSTPCQRSCLWPSIVPRRPRGLCCQKKLQVTQSVTPGSRWCVLNKGLAVFLAEGSQAVRPVPLRLLHTSDPARSTRSLWHSADAPESPSSPPLHISILKWGSLQARYSTVIQPSPSYLTSRSTPLSYGSS